MKLEIFDFDDTLISSDAKIRIYDAVTYKEIVTLTPSQFNHYTTSNNHYCSFSEFEDSQILDKALIFPSMFNKLKRLLEKEKSVSIITARDNKRLILDFFRKRECFLDEKLVFAVGGEDSPYTGNVPDRKSQALMELIQMGYTQFVIYDDNLANLEAMKSLESGSVKIKTNHIVHGKEEKSSRKSDSIQGTRKTSGKDRL